MVGDEGTGDTLRKQVEAAEKASRESEAAVQHAAAMEAKDRSWIARWVIGIFVIAVVFAMLVFLVEGILTGRWDTVAASVFDLVRSAVLPVVTLILGYYFGRSGRI